MLYIYIFETKTVILQKVTNLKITKIIVLITIGHSQLHYTIEIEPSASLDDGSLSQEVSITIGNKK